MLASMTAPPCDNDAPPVLCTYLLGRFEVKVGATAVTAWGGTKPQMLLKRLLVAHPTPVHAESLIATLWPDAMDICGARSGDSEELAYMHLYTTVSQLRRALQAAPHVAGSWVVATSGAYGLRPSGLMWVDMAAFEQLRREGQFVASQGDITAAQETYVKAAALYRGDLLADDPYADCAAPAHTTAGDADRHAHRLGTMGIYEGGLSRLYQLGRAGS